MKYKLTYLLLLSILFIVPVIHAQSVETSSIAKAHVISISDTGKINEQNHGKIYKVTLKILDGLLRDKTVVVYDNEVALPYQIKYKTGDTVVVTVSDDGQGGKTAYISDYDRTSTLLILFCLFILLTVMVARKQGITSILGMLISLYVIVQIIIPNIQAGTDPFVITIIGSLIIIPGTYYLSHGLNKKTTIAIVGTFITLLLTAVLSYIFTHMAKLTGYSSEESVYLQSMYGSTINILNLLIAGILIGGLAVLNDITISQASIVASLRKSNKNLSKTQLYSHAMDVGKDHVASLVNTLILVYVGASLPLVLLFYKSHISFSLILNQELIATEIVRTFVTSIGIIVAVPITTYLACILEK